jgi:hypothetical protein
VTTKTWIGAARRVLEPYWDVPSNWNPTGVPQMGDQVIILSGGPEIKPDHPSLGELQVTLGGTDAAYPAFIKAFGARFESTFSITIPRASPWAALHLEHSATFDGTLRAIGSQLSVTAGASLAGFGTTFIEKGATVTFWGPVPSTQTVTFVDPNGFLSLPVPASFAARITGFQPGNVIGLQGILANQVSYDPVGEVLTVSDDGVLVARLNLSSKGDPLHFHTAFDRFGGTIITSSNGDRTWIGGTGDWFSTENWTTAPPDTPRFPLSGDRVRIPAGIATITAEDVAQHGTLDVERIMLSSPDANAPASLAAFSTTFGVNTTIETIGGRTFGKLQGVGRTEFAGMISASGWRGKLIITAESDGGPARFVNTESGSILAAPEARIDFTAGTIESRGIVLAQGAVSVGASASFAGNGEIRIQRGGHVVIEGAFGSNNYVEFGDSTGILKLANLGEFKGYVQNFSEGNRIDLTNLAVDTVQYDTDSGMLNLFYDGKSVGSLWIFTIESGALFHVQPHRDGGSLITCTFAIRLLQPGFPVPVAVPPGGSLTLQDLLIQGFGMIPNGFATYGLSTLGEKDLKHFDWSYWDPSNPQPSGWSVDGIPIPPLPLWSYIPPTQPTQRVAAGDIGSVQYLAGDNIGPETYLTIPTAGTVDNPTENTTYFLITINPQVLSPTAYSGHVDPADIVATAKRFAAFYKNVPNCCDCGFIADAVAAASGATMPWQDISTDPSANVSGGFWRVVYRGSDQVNPVQDWSTLVQPGDIVRMAWEGGDDGQHTTTIVGKNPDGSLEVYDNGDAGKIGLHPATYWQDTLPESITIYRLDPNHQYLIEGTELAEIIQGSVFNNLIRPGGGQDTITAGAGDNEIRDITAHLNGIKVTDFHSRDTLNFTDLSDSDVTTAFLDGVLTISRPGTVAARINLPSLPSGASFVTRPNGTGGTLVSLVPTP